MDGNSDMIFIDALTTYQFIDSHKISTFNRHLGHRDVIKACHPWHLWIRPTLASLSLPE
jgi:hypothetical protein